MIMIGSTSCLIATVSMLEEPENQIVIQIYFNYSRQLVNGYSVTGNIQLTEKKSSNRMV